VREHIGRTTALAVIAKAPLGKLRKFGRRRVRPGWLDATADVPGGGGRLASL